MQISFLLNVCQLQTADITQYLNVQSQAGLVQGGEPLTGLEDMKRYIKNSLTKAALLHTSEEIWIYSHTFALVDCHARGHNPEVQKV